MAWYSRFLNVFRSDDLSRDVDRELQFHIAELADRLEESGMSRGAALHEARKRFGNRTAQQERTHDADVFVWLELILADLRYALDGKLSSNLDAQVLVPHPAGNAQKGAL